MSAPAALSALRRELTRPVRAVFFDIDETFTTHGKITEAAFSALWRATEAGLLMVPVTGRPAGWCDHIARMWPVAGVVGENGACAFFYDGKKMRRLDVLDARAREKSRRRLNALARRILAAVPGARVASDQGYRDYDLAIDFCEDVKPLGARKIDRIVEIFENAGATAKISSIHVNGWFGDYDKLGMARRLARDILRLDAGPAWQGCVFVGDSPNDQPLFDAFAWSVGVANVKPFLPRIEHPPKFITRAASGAGFAEVIAFLLKSGR